MILNLRGVTARQYAQLCAWLDEDWNKIDYQTGFHTTNGHIVKVLDGKVGDQTEPRASKQLNVTLEVAELLEPDIRSKNKGIEPKPVSFAIVVQIFKIVEQFDLVHAGSFPQPVIVDLALLQRHVELVFHKDVIESTRIRRVFHRHEIRYLGDLVQITEREFDRSMYGLGQKSHRVIRDIMQMHGLTFVMAGPVIDEFNQWRKTQGE
jgi:hypothetical protein